MPVEESSNILILMAALSMRTSSTAFAERHFALLTKWAEYLKLEGLDPKDQLNTDDFAGPSAHNANLSAKAIIALGAYAWLCKHTGRTNHAVDYRALAEQFSAEWIKRAADGDHYRLAFDRPGTWSQKYNLVMDRLLETNLFPAGVRALETNYYLSKINQYGLPLDSRATYTKLDWLVWSASLTGVRSHQNALLAPLIKFLDDSVVRVPLTDFYDTVLGSQQNFKARSVVGGTFLPLLFEPEARDYWLSQTK
jgi:hypothetical protein